MTKAASRQKTNNVDATPNAKGGKNTPTTTNAPVKPASAKATAAATQAVKATATVAATPTREVQSAGKATTKNSNAGKNASTNKAQPATKDVNANMKGSNANANANKTANKEANVSKKQNTPKSGKPKQLVPNTVGVSFVLRLVLGLAPEKRASCQLLREILSLEKSGRIVLTSSNKGLHPVVGGSAKSDDCGNLDENQIRQMTRQCQSDKFQEAMQQLGGEHLYDEIRTLLKEAGDVSVWDGTKDKHALQAKNIRPRAGSANKSVKPQKEAAKQPAKKNTAPQVQSVKKHQSVGGEKTSQTPPPAPAAIKKEDAAKNKGKQVKNAIPEKNAAPEKKAAPEKNATPSKNAAPGKNVSAPTTQSSGAIVGGARAGRAAISKAK
ncbi:hypothetical protein F441_01415 [Phytophthora nicotianae CJ01A1]|uniref:Uncharacterized protein n=3 Tax=Phytophthora nicotianae TaxID=4792 RepID=W2QQ58_PHYN3|nr:hypothetical protein PPTG_06597 [Phytophthora nicotianae INRA-310]ETK95749.1 hypothetical protein L915_01361 [Phytophthora nicotianae]ETP25749.1 hypothetical protein F441_01415 [Phytophthora nicotianae CJ01A1]KUF82518.1 hypothetical protein AM587_10001881 [Phytophthora nicotianae]ETL49138.1 hypothetical protein L916_01335 [Phytophthora nicotianae]ETN15312.1 hypothetical protein PPTG_06597 [Phytophthora nicotianae INRA-310]